MQPFLSYLLTLICFSVGFSGLAQQGEQIRLIHTDELTVTRDGEVEKQWLIGNVRFQHEGALIFCDSALLDPKSNSADAYGKVHLKQGDTLNAYGDTLRYDGATRTANLYGNIRFFDQNMELTTTQLAYDRQSQTARYNNGARIISQQNRNVLTSRVGYYQSETKRLYFRDSVHLSNPQYDMFSDTLEYDSQTETAFFYGPTTIISDSNTIYTENGWYDTKNEVSQFMDRSRIVTKTQIMEGDTMYYDRTQGIGRAYGDVSLIDTANGSTLGGDYAEHFEKTGYTLVTGRTLMTQAYENDTLYLHADTLEAMKDSAGIKSKILAYHHVKFYRTDMQGKCDSMVYTESDSLLTLFGEPALWSDDNQLTGEKVRVKTFEGKIDRIYLDNSAFIISEYGPLAEEQADSMADVKYNQIKGKNMIGFFEDNELSLIRVKGNGQTLYWIASEEKDSSDVATKEDIGLNQAVCSNVEILIEEREIIGIRLLNQVDGSMMPTTELPTKQKLDNFRWFGEYRPLNKDDIFIWKRETEVQAAVIPSESPGRPEAIERK